MSIADQINRLNNAKAAIKQSIKNKGVAVSDEAKLDEYPTLIDRIPTGEGGGSVSDELFYNALTSNGTSYYYLFAHKTIDDSSFIESLDTSKVTDMSYAFLYFRSSSLDLSGWDISNVTKMTYMFNYCNITNDIKIPPLNSKVTSLNSVFQNCSCSSVIGLEEWDTKNITSLEYLFSEFKGNNVYGISNWDVSNVKYFGSLFRSCTNLTEIDISGWDTSNGTSFLTSIYPIIYGCSNLERVIGAIDMSNNNGKINYSATYALTKGCSKLKELRLINIYKNTPVKNEAGYSLYLQDTQIEDQYLIEIIENLPDLINDKGLTATNNLIIMLPPTNTLTQEQVQVAIDKGWNVGNTTY